jgi:hypothetical protein
MKTVITTPYDFKVGKLYKFIGSIEKWPLYNTDGSSNCLLEISKNDIVLCIEEFNKIYTKYLDYDDNDMKGTKVLYKDMVGIIYFGLHQIKPDELEQYGWIEL